MTPAYAVYDLALITEVNWREFAGAIAWLLSLPVEEVEIANSDDTGQLTWKTAATCSFAHTQGDSTWYVRIGFNSALETEPDESTTPPCEPIGAARLADRLGIPILYSTQLIDPTAHWLAAPGGLRTRASCYEFDSDDEFAGFPGFRIHSVECRLPGVPDNIPVVLETDIIRQYPIEYPITSGLESWLDRHKPASPADEAESIRVARSTLGSWEGLTRRMLAGWPPDGWYAPELYHNDLQYRDELPALIHQLPTPVQEQFATALHEVDELFQTNTHPDSHRELATILSLPHHDLTPHQWWWHRLPNNPSWIPPNNGAYPPSCSDITAKPPQKSDPSR